MPMNKPLSTSALILLLIALAAFHWRDNILGRVSDVHTSAVGDNRATPRISPAANPAQISAFVKNREMAQATTPVTTPPVTVPASDPLPVMQAGGQAPQMQTAQAPRTPQPASADMPEVDLSALRYFAARGDTQRLQAEIARLRTLYPNWTPPADPLAIPENGDPKLDAMWQLYTDGRYAEVRKAIADRQQAEPGWQPPDNLIGMLSLAEARQRLVNASDLKQYSAVVDTAANNPALLTCGEVDVLWRVADAFANSDRMGRARDAYLYILNNCTAASDRLATVQKASALLPAEMMGELLAKEKPGADGQLEFEPVKNDLARQFVAKAGEKPKEGEKEGVTVPSAYLMRLERLAETDKLAFQLGSHGVPVPALALVADGCAGGDTGHGPWRFRRFPHYAQGHAGKTAAAVAGCRALHGARSAQPSRHGSGAAGKRGGRFLHLRRHQCGDLCGPVGVSADPPRNGKRFAKAAGPAWRSKRCGLFLAAGGRKCR